MEYAVKNWATCMGWGRLRQQGFSWHLCRAFFLLLLASLFPVSVHAQTVNQYTNTTVGTIVDSTDCSVNVTRTFTVAPSYIVSDVNLGVFLTHTYRSDLRISLRSPLGTTVNIMGNIAGAGDNLNDLFDDEAATSITAHDGAVTDTTAAPPPYSHSYAPGFSANPSGYATTLSAFDGQNAQGTWTMVICDSVAQDVGDFARADLYITQPPASYADLSLTKTVSNAAPVTGATISYTLSATNAVAPSLSATGVAVKDILPDGVSFVSAAGTGTFNSGTGIWTVGTLAPGASASITITVTVTATNGATIINGAEISASSLVDLDSTPNNASTAEDDDAFVSFTVAGTRVAGTAPTLTCPVGTTIFDWDTVAWTAGNTAGTYPVTNVGNISYNLTNPASWLNNATYGGQSPARQNALNGSFTGQNSLWMGVDLANQGQSATAVITLPTAVPGAQFRIFDVDFGAAQYADRVTVTGTFNGVPVTPPVLTNNIANFVIGNTAYGDAASADTQANGNIVVTFQNPVDTITISYGNHSAAPANPGQQWITLHDLNFCNPRANLSVTKISSVLADGISTTNPKAIPGALVRYCILVSNAGSATATSVSVSDPIPANLSFAPGSIFSGPSCGAASVAEDDDASDAAETDPFKMSYTPSAVTATAASLAPAASMAVVFNATVN
jgi:uncharacterized repeat protein (TIGR01451 family)